ncbi:sulfatase-like hydrolase/transferase [Planktomarina temperata]|jgi:arylsulfatase A-like enzyme|nr:sulfatase-like hydrolase/transferase [Planktomarina temperata]MDB9749964.1 sulfatase-like hydrolase/transferase [Planktomarina temperata]MDC1223103.1 sulfatase-like hydrolase/transferase [Planktomarina temperata]|tara:strand:+ start:4224 stop:5786 length:1563 start_codon:yes stop_codon:yes gene_type:complete
MTKRPNFLFIITDQQRADWLGCYGHPVLKTPNIDSIAARGTVFENFHVASPVCMPNRASLLTGRYPSLHGLRYNGCTLPTNTNTFVNVLADAGYHTAAIGKSHLQPFTAMAPMGKTAEEIGEMPEAWQVERVKDYEEEPANYQGATRYDIKLPYYGYQHVDMVTSHGDQCGGHYGQWFKENAPDWKALHDPENQLAHDYSCPQAYRTPIPEDLYPTAYIRDRAIDYITSCADENAPFFTFVSFPDPHHPFNPPGKYWDMYNPNDFEVSLPYDAHKNPTPPMQWLHKNWKGDGGQTTPQTAMMLDDQQIKEAMALTAGMMAFIDDAVGDIIAALEASGQLDNTVICYNADHGDYMGDYNMLLKGALPFRSITRVPFIWSDPDARRQTRSDALCSTVDLAATILDRAGLKPFNGNQGQSFLPAIKAQDGLRHEALIEYNDGGKRLGFEEPARVRSLVTAEWRLTIYRDQDWGELYDLKADPNETDNLWDTADHQDTRAHLTNRLAHHLIAQMDESPCADRLA